jgi:hypothetical protein
MENIGLMKGTPGYQPRDDDIPAGSPLWDVYAYACIILESDMEMDEYLAIQSERESLLKAEKYIKLPDVCPMMK